MTANEEGNVYIVNFKDLEFGSYDAEAYIITTVNGYAGKVAKLKKDWIEAENSKKTECKKAYEDAIQEYGVKVTTKVTISKEELSADCLEIEEIYPYVELGEDYAFKATVTLSTGKADDQGVTWSVSGNKSENTVFVENVLHVAPEEDWGDLTITATSVRDPRISKSIVVSVSRWIIG